MSGTKSQERCGCLIVIGWVDDHILLQVVEQEGDPESRKTSTGSRPPSSLFRLMVFQKIGIRRSALFIISGQADQAQAWPDFPIPDPAPQPWPGWTSMLKCSLVEIFSKADAQCFRSSSNASLQRPRSVRLPRWLLYIFWKYWDHLWNLPLNIMLVNLE